MFSQKEILLMILIVSVLLVFIVILTILDIIEYKREKKKMISDSLDEKESIYDNNDDLEPIKPLDNLEVIEALDTPNEELSEEKMVSKDVDIVKTNIEEEKNVIENNDEEIFYEVEEEIVPKKIKIEEEINRIEETLVDTDEKIENTITNFEEEQERTAIISLDELYKQSDSLYSTNEVTQYDDGNEPISIDEVMNKVSNEVIEESVPVVNTVNNEVSNKELYTHEEKMPFISSIYGMENDDMKFENTANYEKLDRAKTNEFMAKLKEINENR